MEKCEYQVIYKHQGENETSKVLKTILGSAIGI